MPSVRLIVLRQSRPSILSKTAANTPIPLPSERLALLCPSLPVAAVTEHLLHTPITPGVVWPISGHRWSLQVAWPHLVSSVGPVMFLQPAQHSSQAGTLESADLHHADVLWGTGQDVLQPEEGLHLHCAHVAGQVTARREVVTGVGARGVYPGAPHPPAHRSHILLKRMRTEAEASCLADRSPRSCEPAAESWVGLEASIMNWGKKGSHQRLLSPSLSPLCQALGSTPGGIQKKDKRFSGVAAPSLQM